METKVDFEAWVQEHLPSNCVEIVKSELMTFVRLWGLNYLSEALAAFKKSAQYSEMRDIQFKGNRLIVAYANDWNNK